MLRQTEKQKILKELKEDAFRSDIIIPLLSRMGMQQVRERHGTQEYGKDITYYYDAPLGRKYGAVVAKVGNISGAASGRDNLNTILNQAQMAFDLPIEDAETKEKHKINEIIIWTSGTIASNAEHRIIEANEEYRNVQFFSGQKTLELLDKHYPAFYTIRDPYVAYYYAAVKDQYARLEELRALGGAVEDRRLQNIFVPPTLHPFQGRRPGRNTSNTASKQLSIDEVITSKEDFVILGEAGAGKSTLLRRMLLQIIDENELAARKTPIPVFVSMKKVDVSLTDGIEQAAQKEFSRFINANTQEKKPINFDDGSITLLLDSVDELKTETLIKQALQLIAQFKKNHSHTRIIVSSRFSESFHSFENLAEFRIIEIRNLSPKQMLRFIQNWYGEDSAITVRMRQFLWRPNALGGLPSTPLTLALVAALFESGNKEIPANLTELFQKYTELALGRWDMSKDIAVQFEWKIKEFILRKIGWSMQCDERLAIEEQGFYDLVESTSSERGLGVDTTEFCQEVCSRSEIVFMNEDGDYEFKHRSFKDFFAALELDDNPEHMDIVKKQFQNVWWTQTIFFASGLRPSNELYIRLVRDKSMFENLGHLIGALNLGGLLQGAYLTSRNFKIQTVKEIVLHIILSWNPLCDLMENWSKSDNLKVAPISHVNLVHMIGICSQLALGSATLSPVLSDITSDLTKNNSEVNEVDEWIAFGIAMACLRAGNISDFITLFERGIITEPSFLIVSQREVETTIEHAWLTEQEKTGLETLKERFKRRLKKLEEYRNNAIRQSPVPLKALPNISRWRSDNTPMLIEGTDSQSAEEETSE